MLQIVVVFEPLLPETGRILSSKMFKARLLVSGKHETGHVAGRFPAWRGASPLAECYHSWVCQDPLASVGDVETR